MKIKKYLYETAKYALRCPVVIRPYIKEVERLYAMTPEQLKARNEKRFIEIFRCAYDKSPFYHKFYTDAGIKKEDIKSLMDIKKLPVLTKEMVRQHADEMLTVPRWKVIATHTSGTTGTPLHVYRDWTTIWMHQAYIYCTRRRNGFTYGQPLVSLRGNLDRSMTCLKVHLGNTLYFSSYNINPSDAQFYYEKIYAHHPVAIEGYPSSLYTLSLFFRDAGLRLKIPVAFTSSETLLDYQRELIEEQLGTEIFDRYGMTEDTILLHEAFNHNGYYEVPGYSINEYLDDGEICTSLINKAFPLIRYRSGDVMELAETAESNPQIRKVFGRSDDYLVGRNGEICQRLNQIAKKARNSKAMQMVQLEKGKVEILIVPDGEFTKEDEVKFIRAFNEFVGEGTFDYTVRRVNSVKDLIYTSHGKFKMVINRIISND